MDLPKWMQPPPATGTLDWFGYFYDASSSWIYHSKLGWLYVKEDSSGNFWFLTIISGGSGQDHLITMKLNLNPSYIRLPRPVGYISKS